MSNYENFDGLGLYEDIPRPIETGRLLNQILQSPVQSVFKTMYTKDGLEIVTNWSEAEREQAADYLIGAWRSRKAWAYGDSAPAVSCPERLKASGFADLPAVLAPAEELGENRGERLRLVEETDNDGEGNYLAVIIEDWADYEWAEVCRFKVEGEGDLWPEMKINAVREMVRLWNESREASG